MLLSRRKDADLATVEPRQVHTLIDLDPSTTLGKRPSSSDRYADACRAEMGPAWGSSLACGR